MKPWLWLPTSISYPLAPKGIKLLGKLKSYKTLSWNSKTWRDLEFTNPLGIAGGFDKNAELIDGLWTMGMGFIEVGTVTPKAQGANPGKIVDRINSQKALWNKLGFPNKGADAIANTLQKYYQPHFTPIFVNIGKNRSTPLDKASLDYINCMHKLESHADAFVVNISSPNTEGLRELFEEKHLLQFLTDLRKETERPLLLKLSPDMSDEDLRRVLLVSCDAGIDGWILTNTTQKRESGSKLPKQGGVSGAPLKEISEAALKSAIAHLGEKREGKLIVSAGGVLTPKDVFKRLEIGADLVQTYSALVFEGPGFFGKVADQAPTALM